MVPIAKVRAGLIRASLTSQSVQCSDGCLHCAPCIQQQAEMVIGRGGSMTVDCECDAPIPRSELRRCLPTKIFERLLKLEVEHELKTAGVELAHCPCVVSRPASS